LLAQLKPLGVDGFLVTNPLNVTYLTGFTGDSSMLVLGRVAGKARTILVSDSRFAQQIADECGELETHIRTHQQSTDAVTAHIVQGLGWRTLGVEACHLTLEAGTEFGTKVPGLDLLPTANVLLRQRACKDASEIAALRRAIRVAERAFTSVVQVLRPDDTEKDVADALSQAIRRAGGQTEAFPLIVAVGTNAGKAHAVPGERRLAEAGWLLVDWGARVAGYHSDLTRVVRIDAGPGTPKQPRAAVSKLETIAGHVRAAQQAASAQLRPGVAVTTVDAAARQALAAVELEQYFTHGLGHGLGLQIHELPRVRMNSDDVLQAGQVITLEPGVYLPGWGGVRLEDDFLITPDGCERLTTLPQEMVVT
jgi:Xaa-Pro aminopeptidase